MTRNNLIIHVVAEVIVIVIISIYFQRKISNLTGQVRDLYSVINNQQAMINNHEKLLAQMLGVRPNTYNIPVTLDREEQPLPSQPPSQQAAPSVMPMVESLLGMLGSMSGMSEGSQPVVTPPTTNPPQQPEVDIDKELIQELQELNEMRKDEGRIEELETKISPETKTETVHLSK